MNTQCSHESQSTGQQGHCEQSKSLSERVAVVRVRSPANGILLVFASCVFALQVSLLITSLLTY